MFRHSDTDNDFREVLFFVKLPHSSNAVVFSFIFGQSLAVKCVYEHLHNILTTARKKSFAPPCLPIRIKFHSYLVPSRPRSFKHLGFKNFDLMVGLNELSSSISSVTKQKMRKLFGSTVNYLWSPMDSAFDQVN